MTNLEVSFKQQLIDNGGWVPEGQIFDDLSILWDTVRGYKYYAVKIENIDTRKPYLFDINVYDRTKGKSLIEPLHSFPSGAYRVVLYGQPGILKAAKSSEVNEAGLDELQSVSFVSGPVAYGRSPSPTRRSASPGRGRRSVSPLRAQSRSPRRSKSPPRSGRKLSPSKRADPYYRAISSHREKGRSKVIVKAGVPEDQRKFCGCAIDVAKEQSPACLEGRKWFQRIEGKSCYSPYAVCSRSLRTSPAKPCYEHYNFAEMADAELVTVALLHDVPYPKSWDGEELSDEEREVLMERLQSKTKK